MADTIITNSPDKGSGSGDSSAGWVVAIIIIIAVLVGGFALYQNGAFTTSTPGEDTTNIKIEIPDPITPPTETNKDQP